MRNFLIGEIKTLKIAMMLLVVFLFQPFTTVNAFDVQQQEIKGTVIGSDNLPLPGVSILVEGTATGAETDFDGNYTITANKGDVLQFSFVGMKTQMVTVGGNATINVTMQEDASTLDEVVVVGYGTQSRAKVTGAIATLSSDDMVNIPTTNAAEALQGKASGVTLIKGGSPGSSPTIRIRGIGTYGENKPKFVVDGVMVDNIDGLSAEDIESISVLKDASTAAVYGSNGANGIIVIKTKSGKKGETKFSFSTYLENRFKPKTLDLLNSSQYVSYITDMMVNSGGVAPSRFSDAAYVSKNFDYQNAVLQDAVSRNYMLSASGGNKNSTFRFSGNYQTQEGTIINTSLDKYSVRLNSNFKKNKFSYGETMSITYSEQDPLINAFAVSPLENAFRIAPYLPIYNKDFVGGFNESNLGLDGNNIRNPLRTLNRETQLNKTINVFGNVFAKVDLLEGLEFKTSVAMHFVDNKYKRVELPYGGGATLQIGTRMNYVNYRSNTVTFQNSLLYTKTLNEKHNFNFIVLAEQVKRTTNILNGGGSTQLGINDLTSFTGSAGTVEYNKIGYLGRLNYDYDGKYIFAASVRKDGSSRFGPNNKQGIFTSLAAGWVVSNEDFFNEDGFINYVKLRASIGNTGNDATAGDYAFEAVLLANFFYGNDEAIATASLPNPNLKWEETKMTNIGVDLGFLDSKLSFSAEYYDNTSSDLIVNTFFAPSLGATSPTPFNFGGVTTNGIEFNVGYKERTNDFKWSTNFNLSTTNNKVTKLHEEALYQGQKQGVLNNQDISRLAEGEAIWHFYGYVTDGIFQTAAEVTAHATQEAGTAPGDIRFKDINGDGVINADDRTVIGNPFPKISYGMSFDANYKNVDFNMFFTGVSGNDIFNANRYYLDGSGEITNTSKAVLDRWTPTNPSTSQPRAIFGDPNKNTRVSDRYVEKGSYLRLKNISVGYSLPSTTLDKFGGGAISKFRLYLSAQNLLTITNYSGYDPEIGPSPKVIAAGNGNINSELGVDRGQYPQSKSVLLGLQIKF